MAKRIRIIDIALRAKVSKGTVDRVIHKRGNVSEQAKSRVLQAMKELDYQPNLLASALAQNRNLRIAALLPNTEDDPFWQQPKEGIQRALKAVRDYGISIDFYSFKDSDNLDFTRKGNQLLQSNYKAVLLAPIFLKEANHFLDQCEKLRLKYVLINTFLKRTDASFLCYIGQDSYQSGVLAAKLLNFGLSDGEKVAICHLEKEVYNSKHLLEKEKGFSNFFLRQSNRNIQVITLKFENIHQSKSFRNYVKQNLAIHPKLRGIFVTTSKAHYLLDILKDLGREDLKIVGFDLIAENLLYLHRDSLHFLINQNPLKQGYLAILNIFNHFILKRQVKPIQHLPLDIVMPENVNYYLEEEAKLHLIF